MFKFGASKTRNKNVRREIRAMRSDIAKMVVEEAQNKAKNKYDSLFDQSKMGGISNYQIEDAFKKIGDEDLLENFAGVFSSNYMSKFMNHTAMISGLVVYT